MLRHHQMHPVWRGGGERGTRDHNRETDQPDVYIEAYEYTASFGNIASAASNTQTLQVQADSDFEWRKTMFVAEPHGGTAPFADNQIPELALMVTDTGSGRQQMNVATPLNAIAGKGALPYIKPVTYIFEAKSTITLTINNWSASGSGGGALQWDNIYLILSGNKIWHYGKAPAKRYRFGGR